MTSQLLNKIVQHLWLQQNFSSHIEYLSDVTHLIIINIFLCSPFKITYSLSQRIIVLPNNKAQILLFFLIY